MHRTNRFIWILALVSLLLPIPAAQAKDGNVRLDIGFAHWFSDAFRSAEQGQVFSLGAGYVLPFKWMELRARYEWADARVDASSPDYAAYNGKRFEFLTIGPALRKEFRIGRNRIALTKSFASLLLVRAGGGDVITGQTGGMSVEWLVGHHGIAMDVREQGYDLPLLGGDGKQIDVNWSVSYIYRF